MNLEKVILYDETASENFSYQQVGDYLKELLPSASIEYRGQFFKPESASAAELAGSKVRNLYSVSFPEPLYGEILFEKKVLENPEKASAAVLYDGSRLQQIACELIREEERDIAFLHIVFSKRFFGSFDEGDRRYHARVVVLGFPNIISTTGVVEAPAKPKKYYELRNRFVSLGLDFVETKLREELHGQFLDYEDERMTEVVKGYALQAIFYHLFDQSFCSEKNCRLYNGHWQEEVIQAQINSGQLCSHHREMLRRYADESSG